MEGTFSARPVLVIRHYTGNSYDALIDRFEYDAQELARQGYVPAGQHYVEGQWGCAWGAMALILTPFLVGIALWVNILTSRPVGTLTVTYRLG